jgi:hypothetical protein
MEDRSMSRVIALVVALLLSTVFVARSGAAQLAPKKASDLRTVSNLARHTCPNLLLGVALDTAQKPDGTTAPFVVPPGSVFILTSWEWADCASTPDGLPPVVSLFTDNGVTQAILGFSGGPTISRGSTNCSAGTVETPGGVAIKSGPTLCVSDNNASVIVHGFITRDN